MRSKLKDLLTKVLLILAIFCILFAASITLARLIVPHLNLDKTKLENWASTTLTQPVLIKNISPSWDSFSPVLQFEEVKVLNDARAHPLIYVDRLGLRISLLQSLLKRTLVIDKLLISGAKLNLKQSQTGAYSIEGTEGLEKQFNTADNTNSLVEISDWLFAQQEVVIDNSHLRIERYANTPISIAGLNLHFINNGTQHHIIGQTAISQQSSSSILVDAKMEGNLHDLDKFKADLYLRINNLRLKQWLKNISPANFTIKSGTLNANIWANWRNQHWVTIQSQLKLNQLDASIHQQHLKLHDISGIFNLHEVLPDLWSVAITDLKISRLRKPWPLNKIHLFIRKPFSDTQKIEQFTIDYIDQRIINFIKPFLPEAEQTIINQLKPQGRLHNLVFRSFRNNDFNLSTTLENISVQSYNKIPGIAHLSGLLQFSNKDGRLSLNSHDTVITFGKLFRNPIRLTTLQGQIDWLHQNQTWLVKAENILANNADLNTHTDLALTIPADNSGIRINLLAGFNLLNIKNKSLYLPSGILSKKLITWLDSAIVDGKAGTGALILRGNLKDFPFSNNKGRFLVVSKLEDITLNYKKKWPVITGLDATMIFDTDEMVIKANRGAIFNSKIISAQARIPQLSADESQLNIVGEVAGNLNDGINFIHNSPLSKTLAKAQSINLNGPMRLALQLAIPLDSDKAVKIAGNTQFDNALLDLPQWGLSLNLANGILNFTEDSFNTSLIKGNLFETPINLQINKAPNTDKTIATIEGSLDINRYINQSPFNDWLNGSLPYNAILTLNKQAPDSLDISSSLAGLTVNLPTPLSKPTHQAIHSNINILLTATNSMPISFNYGDQLKGKIQLAKKDSIWLLKDGRIDISNGAQIDKTNDTLFNWQEWKPFIDNIIKLQASNTSPSTVQINQIEFNFAKLKFQQYILNQTQLRLKDILSNWKIGITNRLIKGDVQIPQNKQLPWLINLDYLHLPESDNDQKDIPNITDIPNIQFSCQDLTQGKKNLGKVDFILKHLNPTTLHIARLNIISKNLKVFATGQWQQKSNINMTALKGDALSTDLRQTLKDLDLPAGITSKDARLEFILNYPNVPYDPSLKSMQGSIKLRFKNGQLLDMGESNSAKLGFGRLLTLLSVQSITKRLKLDFSDLSAQGFGFDILQGQFKIYKGTAYTNNFKIDGPVARINIRGKVGIKTKDYDLELAIIPHLTSSLPIIATIAGGPVAGVVTWAADKILNSEVKRTAQYNYKMTGPWFNPTIKPITTQ